MTDTTIDGLRSPAKAVQAAESGVVAVRRANGSRSSGMIWRPEVVITTSQHLDGDERHGLALSDGGEIAAELVGIDPATDVAVLRPGSPLEPLPRRTAGELRVGEPLVALGRAARSVRASLHIVSLLNEEGRTALGGRLAPYVETDRQLAAGFSGGPFVDLEGQVLGMSSRYLGARTGSLVPNLMLDQVVEEILQHGSVRRGYLGVAATRARLPQSLQTEGAPSSVALLVAVEDDSAAGRSGLLLGDAIAAVDGAPVRGPGDLQELLRPRPGDTAKLRLLRAGQWQEQSITIGERAGP